MGSKEEKIEIVEVDGQLYAKYCDGSMKQILVDIHGVGHYGRLIV